MTCEHMYVEMQNPRIVEHEYDESVTIGYTEVCSACGEEVAQSTQVYTK